MPLEAAAGRPRARWDGWLRRLVATGAALTARGVLGGITDDESLLLSDGSWHRGQRKRVPFETSCYYAQEPELAQGCQYSRSQSYQWREDPQRKEEREVLLALHSLAGGALGLWRADENWGEDTDPCWDQWYGITCDEHGHVIALDLADNGLYGSLPENLGRLTSLIKIDFSTSSSEVHSHPNEFPNLLIGKIPSLKDCKRLEEIEVSGNEFEALPEDLWMNGPTLRTLSANHNKLTALPKYLQRFVKLHTMELSHNEIADEFPLDFGYMANVRFVQLEYNQLYGEIPANIVGMRKCRVLDLSHNPALTGELPEDVIVEWKDQDYLAIMNTSIVGYLSSLCLDVPFCWKFMYDTHKDLTWGTASDVPDIVQVTLELAMGAASVSEG